MVTRPDKLASCAPLDYTSSQVRGDKAANRVQKGSFSKMIKRTRSFTVPRATAKRVKWADSQAPALPFVAAIVPQGESRSISAAQVIFPVIFPISVSTTNPLPGVCSVKSALPESGLKKQGRNHAKTVPKDTSSTRTVRHFAFLAFLANIKRAKREPLVTTAKREGTHAKLTRPQRARIAQ
jgi:hypothetical protein